MNELVALDSCDVPLIRRNKLGEFRKLRTKCLHLLNEDKNANITGQLLDAVWHTATYKLLNETRKSEYGHPSNPVLWDFVRAGFTHITVTAIRRLSDHNAATNSLRAVLKRIRTNRLLFTRENYVCFNGAPYEQTTPFGELFEVSATDTAGFELCKMRQAGVAPLDSILAHHTFDTLARTPASRRKDDVLSEAVLDDLEKMLACPEIERIRTFTDKAVAHAETSAWEKGLFSVPTYSDIDVALEQIVGVRNYIASELLRDATLASALPTASLDVTEHLDKGLWTTERMPELRRYWKDLESKYQAMCETSRLPSGA